MYVCIIYINIDTFWRLMLYIYQRIGFHIGNLARTKTVALIISSIETNDE